MAVGSFQSYAEFQEAMIPNEACELAAAERAPYEEAVRRLRARNARDLELEALDARLAAADPAAYAGMIRWSGQGRVFSGRRGFNDAPMLNQGRRTMRTEDADSGGSGRGQERARPRLRRSMDRCS